MPDRTAEGMDEEMIRRVLLALYECAAAAQGAQLMSISITGDEDGRQDGLR